MHSARAKSTGLERSDNEDPDSPGDAMRGTTPAGASDQPRTPKEDSGAGGDPSALPVSRRAPSAASRGIPLSRSGKGTSQVAWTDAPESPRGYGARRTTTDSLRSPAAPERPRSHLGRHARTVTDTGRGGSKPWVERRAKKTSEVLRREEGSLSMRGSEILGESASRDIGTPTSTRLKSFALPTSRAKSKRSVTEVPGPRDSSPLVYFKEFSEVRAMCRGIV